MIPEYPMEIPPVFQKVMVTSMMDTELMDCQMVRCGVQCGNTSTHGMLIPKNGLTCIIPICDTCIDELASQEEE